MIEATRLASHAALRFRTRLWAPLHLPQVARASTLSAIHRGIHRGNRTDQRDVKGRPDVKGRTHLKGRMTRQPRQDPRRPLTPDQVRSAIAHDTPEATGRMSRRKRFMDPNHPFGKKSLVWRVKFGDLKDKADEALARDDVEDEQDQAMWRGRGRRGRAGRPDAGGRMRDGSASEGQGRESAPARERAGEEAPRRRGREGAPGGRGREGASEVSTRSPRRNEDEMGGAKPKPNKRRDPISIPRTTAASQFIYGASAINSALKARRRKLYRLYVLFTGRRAINPDYNQINNPKNLAKLNGVPVTFLDEKKGVGLLDKMSGGRPHNGYVLEASPVPQLPITALSTWTPGPPKADLEVVLGHQSKEEEAINGTSTRFHFRRHRFLKPFVVFFYQVADEGNLGAMIRSAVFLGASAVVITAGKSAAVTPVVTKAASGAADEIPIFSVDSPLDFISASQKAGWHFYAAAASALTKNIQTLSAVGLEKDRPLTRNPCVLMLGNEARGIPKPLRIAADFNVCIPGVRKSSVDSLNVSVAGGILFNAFLNPVVARQADSPEEEASEEMEEDADQAPSGEAKQQQSGEGEAEKKQPADDEERLF